MTTFTEPPESPLGRALARRSGGDIDGAIEILLAATGESLADANLAVTLGKMLAETGQYRRAEPWFRHAMKLAPDDVVVRMGYGAFLGEVGQFEEARALLGGVRREVRTLLETAAPEERASLVGLEGFIASTEINLARAAFEAGDSAFARALVGPWLADRDHWPSAHAVLADVVDRDGLDPTQVAEEGLASGQVSPYMACHLLERIVDAEACDFGALDELVARADACFAFDWKWVEPPLVAVFARARQLFAHAVMRGVVAAAACPHLAALVAQPGPATDGGANGVDDAAAVSPEDENGDDVEDEDEVDAGSDDEDRSLEAFARAFIGHWASVRDRIAAGEDVAFDRVDAFASDDPDRQLALAREYYALERAKRFSDLSIDEAVELIEPWAETASDLIDAYGCVETIRALVAAEYVLAVYGKWVLPVTHAGAVGVWEATCGGVGNGGSFWLRKTTGEPFGEDEGATLVRWIEEEFESDAEEMGDDARVSAYLEDAYVIAGDASSLGEDDDDEDDDDGEDEGEGPESDFEGVLRLAGWNDTEPGIQISLGRRAGVWCFQTGDADYPAVPEAVAESLVALFERGVAGIAPRRTLRPLAVDRNWLVEGPGTSQVMRFDVIAPEQWPLVNAAMAVFEVHAVLVAFASEPSPPFAVLIASGPNRLAAIEACWSDDGFLYRRKSDPKETHSSIGGWSEDATTDLASLVPDLDRLMPIVLHPLAAWELLEPVRALQSDQTAPCRRDWLDFAEKAIATYAPATLLPPLTPFGDEDMADQNSPTEITLDRELVGVQHARVDENGYLTLDLGDRVLGPPALMTKVREPFVAFRFGVEGGGGTILARLERGSFVFWRETSVMTVDGDGPEDAWTRSTSSRSRLFVPLVLDDDMHHYFCLQLHPLVAYTMLETIIRCIVRGVIARRPKSLEAAMVGLGRMIAAAIAPDSEPVPPGLDGLLREADLGYAVPRWMRAIRASLRGRTTDLYADDGE